MIEVASVEPTVIELDGPMEVGALALRLSQYDLRERIVIAYPVAEGQGSERVRKLASGLLTYDCWLQTVDIGDPPVVSTQATYNENIIFERLTREEDVPVSREELRDLFGVGVGDIHVVDVHVSNLRRKFGPARNYIRTLRGVGFYAHSAAEIEI